MIFLLFHKRKKKLASRAPSEHQLRCAPSAKRKKLFAARLLAPTTLLFSLNF